LDEARAKEALREADEANRYFTFLEVATLAARRAREGWTPPEPVDPDLAAFLKWHASHPLASFQEAYIAGVWMARKQEQERAEVLVEYVEADARRLDGVGDRARAVLAKHRGEA
ncbi:MAG: hypothetical protein IM667_11380, partial [Phenylobacterium sp.]|uniref:hypothetical protein n=1 Tax=Phenylobacterium sp. TaxID=1871053 RepID=UPI0025CF9CFD